MANEARRAAAKWIRENAPGLCFDDSSIGEDDLASLESLLDTFDRAGWDRAIEAAAQETERIYDNGLGGAHQGEQCIRTAGAIRALPYEPPVPEEGK